MKHVNCSGGRFRLSKIKFRTFLLKYSGISEYLRLVRIEDSRSGRTVHKCSMFLNALNSTVVISYRDLKNMFYIF